MPGAAGKLQLLHFQPVPHGLDVLQQYCSLMQSALSLQVTISGAPVTNQHLSSPLKVESSPAELDADAAADTSSSPSPSSSPVSTIHSAFLSELPSPMAIEEALITVGTSPESPKVTPLVNRSQRPALANLTNRLTPQVILFCDHCVLAKHCIA